MHAHAVYRSSLLPCRASSLPRDALIPQHVGLRFESLSQSARPDTVITSQHPAPWACSSHIGYIVSTAASSSVLYNSVQPVQRSQGGFSVRVVPAEGGHVQHLGESYVSIELAASLQPLQVAHEHLGRAQQQQTLAGVHPLGLAFGAAD
jgi:hypothetical protein